MDIYQTQQTRATTKDWIRALLQAQYIMPVGTLHIWNTVVNRKALLLVNYD